MKKIAFLLVLAFLSGVIVPKLSYAYDPNVFININGQRIYPDVPPFILNDRTLVPVRGVFEKLGATVQWLENEQKAVVNYHDTVINLQINNKTALINGVEKQMDVPPIIFNNRTMIPLRFIAENMGMWVQWVPEANVATITDPLYFSSIPSVSVLGYTTNDYKGDTGSYNSLLRFYRNIDTIATFSYGIDTDANLKASGEPQNSTINFANLNDIKSLALIHNFSGGKFDKDLAHAVLSDQTKRKKLINNILITLSREEYAGVNIDFENISWQDRQNYSSFVKELKETLTPYGYLTTVSIPAKTYDSYIGNNWSGGFDYGEIGRYADQIVLMTYDEHYFEGSAGPISSFPWVESVLRYATSTIAPSKLLLGIAAYGYDWSSSGSRVITFKNADAFISGLNAQVLWDDVMKSPYFFYSKDGIIHEVWYENVSSISHKLDLLGKYQLGGIGIWRLGYENESFWSMVSEKLAWVKNTYGH